MKKILIAVLIIAIVAIAAYFSKSYWMPGISPIQEIVIDTGLIETGIVKAEITGEVINTIPKTNEPYQSGKYLYMPKIGLKFTLPNGWSVYELGDNDVGSYMRVNTNYLDKNNNVVRLSIGISKAISKNNYCKEIPGAGNDCENIDEDSELGYVYDSIFESGKNNLLGIACDGYCGHLVIDKNFRNPHNINYGINSDSLRIECPVDSEECYGREPTFEKDSSDHERIWQFLGTAEEIK